MGFLRPENLVYLLAIAALLLIYLWSRSRPVLDVSSILLFDEVQSPITSARWLRLDLLFWLEATALGALVLALAGLYLRTPVASPHARVHALVFDLGAGMAAREGAGTRLGEAEREALALVDSAAADERFAVITYALEAETLRATAADRASIRSAIKSLRSLDVRARPQAFAAAMMRAYEADSIDIFADRAPAGDAFAQAGANATIRFHRVGTAADNVAIAALDPGSVHSSQGHCTLKSFSDHPRMCELEIDCDQDRVLKAPVMLEPRAEVVVPFGPLPHGGLVAARLLTPDALDSDNQRWSYAQSDAPAKVLVISPDAGVRDDLARTLLAINENFAITALDSTKLPPKLDLNGARFAVLHDFYSPQIRTPVRLFIYPPSGALGIKMVGTARLTELDVQTGANELAEPVGAAALRLLSLPLWMSPLAVRAGGSESTGMPIAAIGYDGVGAVGLIAFDVRKHLLLNPDNLGAMVLTLDLIKQLMAPEELRIVSTGTYLDLPAGEPIVRLAAPDGTARTIRASEAGRIRFAALEAGRYRIESGDRRIEVLANYFDASESELSANGAVAPVAPRPGKPVALGRSVTRAVQPLNARLLALAFAAFLVESIILALRASRRRVSDV